MIFNLNIVLNNRLSFLQTKYNFYLPIKQIKVIYTIKSDIISNQTLDQKVVIFILNRIILPMIGFKTHVLMNSPLGKHIILKGGILMSIRKKFWVAMLIYIIITWCFALVIIWIVYN